MTSPTKCPHCNGTGAWVNPHDALDARTCRRCKGTGTQRGVAKAKLHHTPDKATERDVAKSWPQRDDPRDDAYWDKLAEEFREWP